MKNFRKFVWILWILTIIAFWIFVVYEDVELTPETIASYLAKFQKFIVVIYLIFGILRAFVLIPNMTYVLVGTLLIHNFYILLFTSVIGLLASSSIIYFFGEELGLEPLLKKKFPDKIKKINSGLQKYGSPVIFFWGFLPVVPSDLLSFTLGTLKFNYWKFIFLYGTSHMISYTFIILLGEEFWKWFLF